MKDKKCGFYAWLGDGRLSRRGMKEKNSGKFSLVECYWGRWRLRRSGRMKEW